MSTAAYIAFHAAQRPQAIALVDHRREITYADFARDIERWKRVARGFELSRGSVVAVGCDQTYPHWLLLLAFEELGIVTVSFPSGENEAGMRSLADVDLLLAEPHFPKNAAKRFQAITADWLQSAAALSAEAVGETPPKLPDDPLRILRTSGTTGVPKRILLTRRTLDTRADRYALSYGFTQDSRYLLTMSFGVGHIYAAATACIRMGGMTAVDTSTSVAQALSSHRITHVTLFPLQLKRVLDELPEDFQKPAALRIYVAAAGLSPALRARAMARLAIEAGSGYGCNEVGHLCREMSGREDGFVSVLPGVRIEAVDEHDRPVATGRAGKIRIKTDTMVEGYLDDPDASARMFRGGWFYPGDLGVLDQSGRLRILGRSDELLNLGGEKVSPSILEEMVQRRMPVKDVAACSFPNAEGIEEIYVAVVAEGADDRALLDGVTSAFEQRQFGAFYVIRLPQIPRNELGKIDRARMKALIGDWLERQRKSK